MAENLYKVMTFHLEDFGKEMLQILKKHNDRPTTECLLEIVSSREKWAKKIMETVRAERDIYRAMLEHCGIDSATGEPAVRSVTKTQAEQDEYDAMIKKHKESQGLAEKDPDKIFNDAMKEAGLKPTNIEPKE